MNFSDTLKAMRISLGLTQKSLGEKIGVTSVTIGNWERGARAPSFDLLSKLAEALDTSVDILLGIDLKTNCTPPEEQLLTKYRQLDQHGKDLVDMVCDAEYSRIKSSL